MTDCKNCKYTDEYCASGDCTTQNDLTEQWKKCELPEGHYYVKDGGNMIAEYLDGYFYNDGNPMTSFSGGIDEVLAPVPSYEEWKALKASYEMSNDANLKQATWMVDMEKENAQLKELLEECRNSLEEQSNVRKLYESDVEYRDRYNKKMDLLIKLDEVLK